MWVLVPNSAVIVAMQAEEHAAEEGRPGSDAGQQAAPVAAVEAPAESLCCCISEAIAGRDLTTVSVGELRQQVAQMLGFPAEGLDGRTDEFTKLTEVVVQELGATSTVPFLNQLLTSMKEPDNA